MTVSFTTLVVGRDLVSEPVADVRTEQQRRAVAEIVSRPDFAFAYNNPFTPGVGAYTGVFHFLWYTTDDVLHAVKIGKRGNILLAARKA